MVDTAREDGADRWFFVCYTNPDGHHLRLRLHGDPGALWPSTAPALGHVLSGWQESGLLRAHRVDQYDPELERYGGAELAGEVEQLFAADSAAVIDLLNLAAGPACPYKRGHARQARGLGSPLTAHAWSPCSDASMSRHLLGCKCVS